ncbi:unnamed protein product [Orchesella dallaii]|uniref:Zinc finger CHCC-type domain-containing protein n=1 Tax=Orchesella dallaii TaxID=48710 RepID=A0ABP1QFK6_9HEXA
MALRQSLNRIPGFSRGLLNSHGTRSLVSTTNVLSAPSKDTPTHTGQQFEEDDYRLVRFIDKTKQVNQKFAIDLIAEVPPEAKQSRVVWCDGGGGPTGHPRVYINLDQPGNHSCGYCGLRFYKDSHHH